MGSEARRILESALALPDHERADLATELLASLDKERDPDAEQAWASEITRRAERFRAGEADLVDAAEVHEQMRSRFRST